MTWDGMVYMQDMNSFACNSQPTPLVGETNVPTKTLTDKRDGNTYTIAKLKDGNCWMTQNLKLINKTISSADSDMESGSFIVPASDKTGFSSSDQNTPKAYLDSTYGSYYNWYTATAGTGDSTISTSGQNAPYSICPKGWQLPINGNTVTDKSYAKLLHGLASGSVIITAPYSFVYGGVVNSSSLYDAGSYGYYWSSTASSATVAYFLSFSSSYVSPSNGSNRYYGSSVRCVAR